MIVENCKLYYQSQERNQISADRVQHLPDTATFRVDANRSLDTSVTFSIQAEILLNEWYFIQDFFLTTLEVEHQFHEQCRRDLHRWFRENEPFINDLAEDIATASRTNFRIFRR